jgi:RNA recognition motif-containing protein
VPGKEAGSHNNKINTSNKLKIKGETMRIYVGNLSYDVTEEDLRNEFAAYGKVSAVSIVTDKYSGRSKGFAFIDMPEISEGQQAITNLNGKTLKERTMSVSAAKERTDDRRSSYGSGRGGSSYGGNRRSGGFDRGSGGRRY